MAGMLGCGGGSPSLFFSARSFETKGLKKGISDHRHQGVSMQADPGSAFEMIEAKFFLELLMRLFGDPSGLNGRDRPPLTGPRLMFVHTLS